MAQRWTLPPAGCSLVDPPFAEWVALAEKNRALADSWDFEVAGRPVGSLREIARHEALKASEALSAKLAVPVRGRNPGKRLLVMAGHQPALYHPGVWIKNFLMQRFADAAGANALDLVVDSDGFDSISAAVPCLDPPVRKCVAQLASAQPGGCYAVAPVPEPEVIDAFCLRVEALLGGLPTEAPRANFSAFAECLRSAAEDAENLAELVTIARRRYESAAGTSYGELAVTSLARTSAFSAFAADLALSADRFAEAYNAELHAYRRASRTRSAAQPFPDLGRREGLVESPFWFIAEGVRSPVWAERLEGGGARLIGAEGTRTLELPPSGPEAAEVLLGCGWQLAPKALALTLFARVFCCDLFVHGTGGGRYDAVTDGVCRRYFGAEPPAFAVTTLTLRLPVEFPHPEDAEISAARERLNRLGRNPDEFLGEIEFASMRERAEAEELAAEKTRLRERIASPEADKKALGTRIREINERLAELTGPARARLSEHLEALEAQREAWDIVSDRGYPFCYWSPQAIADRAATA
ncbi:MAG: hypothetical protein AB2L09_04685 [Coriobacteriia bacterium]